MSKIPFQDIAGNREFCNCGNLMQFQQQFKFEDYDDSYHLGSPYYAIELFQIFTCSACNSATVILYTTVVNEDEHYDIQDEMFRDYSRKVLYAPKKQLHPAIPKAIQEVLDQAESVISNSPRASFILCRAVLEEICNDFEIPTEQQNNKGKNYFIKLHDRLSQLFEQEKLPEELQIIIKDIKDFGNEGAHSTHLKFSQQVEIEDAGNLIMLVKYVLERLYVDRYRQKEAKNILKTLKSKVLPQQK